MVNGGWEREKRLPHAAARRKHVRAMCIQMHTAISSRIPLCAPSGCEPPYSGLFGLGTVCAFTMHRND